jgi:ankyrin repeat protein
MVLIFKKKKSFWGNKFTKRGIETRCMSSPLFAATGIKNPDLVLEMLKSGCHADRRSLCQAVLNNDLATVEVILRYKPLLPSCHVHEINDPIEIAVENGHTDMVRLLIGQEKYMAEWSMLRLSRTTHGTPLQKAAQSGSIDMVQLLLNNPWDINAPPYGELSYGLGTSE